ncbi:hypothetical protein D8674_011724 [Pyrus ussuriensis x Pyrus communis]|uniref:Uncharacterized protein n=1 Tax=Pyrus ussuriensis x Pyrus communis TaxID=2448454 RepID=A0A5N5FZN1_9ROSA|nr:hypothetical protein D8674_011724 [Pyrus ussuriensis x Pyrus communis]
MTTNSKRHWNNPHSEFYTPSLKKHLEQYFEKFNAPQKLSVEDKLFKLLESIELYIERTNQEFQIQPLINYGKRYDDQEEIGAETEEKSTSQSCPREETPPADRETISAQSSPPQVYVPPEAFPTGLHECTRIDMLEAVHSKSVYQTSHDQLLTTMTILDSDNGFVLGFERKREKESFHGSGLEAIEKRGDELNGQGVKNEEMSNGMLKSLNGVSISCGFISVVPTCSVYASKLAGCGFDSPKH